MKPANSAFFFIALLLTVGLPAQPTGTWIPKKPLPTPRGFATAAVIGDQIYVIGGVVNVWECTPVMEVYDLATDTWDTTKASLPAPVCAAASAVVGGKIYVIGGKSSYVGTGDFLNSVYVYDTKNERAGWIKLDDSLALPTPRAFHSACVVGDTAIYVIGGRHSSTFSLSVVEKFVPSPGGGKWTQAADLNDGRSNFACGVLPDGKMYVMAGYLQNCTVQVATVEVFDPAGADKWVVKETAPTASRSHPGFGVYDGSVYLFGGVSADALPVFSVFQYSPQTGFIPIETTLPEKMAAFTSGVAGHHFFTIGGVTDHFLTVDGPQVSASNWMIDLLPLRKK